MKETHHLFEDTDIDRQSHVDGGYIILLSRIPSFSTLDMAGGRGVACRLTRRQAKKSGVAERSNRLLQHIGFGHRVLFGRTVVYALYSVLSPVSQMVE